MALQSQTFANSGSPYYGNPADWSKYSTLNSTISFNDTNAKLKVIPAVPDANTTITFNGNQLAYVSDIPNLANWAQYSANHDVTIPSPYIVNGNTANFSTINGPLGNISTLNTSTLKATTGTIPLAYMKDIIGSTITITADEGPTLAVVSQISLNTTNGTYGKIDMTANPGYLNALGGLINMTANGGNANGGLYGAVNIVANPGTEQTTGITTGGLVTITANSGNLDLPTATSAIKINASGVNSYAGAIPAIGSLAGYNFMYGTGGVNICAGLPPVFPQIPLTTYLYGTAGIVLNSDVYTTDVYPYWNGLSAPANLTIHGRTTISGSASVVLSNVSTMGMQGGGAITGVNSINGVAYPPTTTVPPNLSLSTLTMNPTGYISTNTIVNGGIKIDMGYGIPNVLSLTYPTGTSGYVNILEQGYGAGVLKVGSITNLSTINGLPFNSSFIDSYQIYVAPNGNNTTGIGSQQNPYQTIARALTARALISNTIETSIILSSGTYTETFTLLRNTYLVGVQTGEARQPVNIIGAITMNDTTGSMGLSGLEITGSVSTLGGGATYTLFGCNISNTAMAIAATAGTVFITECRISTTAGQCITSFSNLTIRDCSITTSGTSSCIGNASITTIRQCVIVSTSASTAVAPLVNVSTDTATTIIEFCRLEYTSAVTDVGGAKCCIRFANPTGTVSASVSNSLLICEGAITGVGPNIQCIQKSGAGAVTLAYGQLIAGIVAHHIAPAITKTQYFTVP